MNLLTRGVPTLMENLLRKFRSAWKVRELYSWTEKILLMIIFLNVFIDSSLWCRLWCLRRTKWHFEWDVKNLYLCLVQLWTLLKALAALQYGIVNSQYNKQLWLWAEWRNLSRFHHSWFIIIHVDFCVAIILCYILRKMLIHYEC